MKKRVRDSGNSMQTWIYLLVIITALSLVGDILFLNGLYGLEKNNKNLQGNLATLSDDGPCVIQAKEDLLWGKRKAEERYEKTIAEAKTKTDAAWYQWKLGATDNRYLQRAADERYVTRILNFSTIEMLARRQLEADNRLADAEYEEALERCEEDDNYEYDSDPYESSQPEPVPDMYYDYSSTSMYA